nr:restriction endonuclease subunit S [uncultured Brevundimonas sp.]
MTPNLRFPEFNGEWKNSQLGDFFTFKNGVNADKSMYGTGRKFINVMDVIADGPITHDAIIGSVEISEKEYAKNEVVYGDVLFQRSSETREEVGQSNIYVDQQPATFGGFVIRGRPKQTIDPYYFDALLKTAAVRKDMTSRSGGSTRYNIGQESLDAVTVCVAPSLAEQQKIAAYLGTVDARIRLLKRRYMALGKYKKGVMQRLFTQTIRFKRDDGAAFPDWEEKRLGDVAIFMKGKGISKDDIVPRGALPCIRYGELYTIYAEKIDAVASTTDVPADELLLSEKGDVILPASGETPLDMASASCVLKNGVALGGDLNVIRSPINGLLLAYLLRSHNRRDVARLAQGNSVVHLYGVHLATLKLTIPVDLEEQRKIAGFLSALDDKIAAVSATIDVMQTFKKGLLQQMFV